MGNQLAFDLGQRTGRMTGVVADVQLPIEAIELIDGALVGVVVVGRSLNAERQLVDDRFHEH